MAEEELVINRLLNSYKSFSSHDMVTLFGKQKRHQGEIIREAEEGKISFAVARGRIEGW